MWSKSIIDIDIIFIDELFVQDGNKGGHLDTFRWDESRKTEVEVHQREVRGFLSNHLVKNIWRSAFTLIDIFWMGIISRKHDWKRD